MARKTAKTKKKSTPAFTFKLGWAGFFGVVVVTLCVFLWMFMLGVWAGQTVLLPPAAEKKKLVTKPASISAKAATNKEKQVRTIHPDKKKVEVK